MSQYEAVYHDKHDDLYGPTITRSLGGDPNEVITGFVETVPMVAPHNVDVASAPADEVTESTPPPKSGAGSGRDEWVAYAESLGIEVSADDTRDDIIAAVESNTED